MLKKRLIPVILLRNGQIVQSRNFRRYQNLGSPTVAVERLNSWACDELIYLDISQNSSHDFIRQDINHPTYSNIIDIIKLVSKKCQMPLTFGGGIRNFEDVSIRLKNGADKITLNTIAIENISLITDIAKNYGSQCVVISVDVYKDLNGNHFVYKRGKEATEYNPVDFSKMVEDAGAGEILLNSVNNDGSGNGFDIELINSVVSNVRIPVIAIGGAGKWEHFEEALAQTDVSAVAAANIFQHSENSVYNCRKYLFEKGFNIRKPVNLSNSNSNL